MMEFAGFQALSEDTDSDSKSPSVNRTEGVTTPQDQKTVAKKVDEATGNSDEKMNIDEDDVLTIPVTAEASQGSNNLGEDEEERLLNPDGNDKTTCRLDTEQKINEQIDHEKDNKNGEPQGDKTVSLLETRKDNCLNNITNMDSKAEGNQAEGENEGKEEREAEENMKNVEDRKSEDNKNEPSKTMPNEVDEAVAGSLDEKKNGKKEATAADGSETDSAPDSQQQKQDTEEPQDKEMDVASTVSGSTNQDGEDFVILEDESGGPPKKVKKFKKSTTPRIKSGKAISPLVLLPFEAGWGRELVYRATFEEFSGKRPADVYYFTPEGVKLRSMPQILDYLRSVNSSFTAKNFTFHKETIYREPQERVRYANKVGRGKSIGTPNKPSPSKGSPTVKKSLDAKKTTPNGTTEEPVKTEGDLTSPPRGDAEVAKVSPVKKLQQVAKKKTGPRKFKPVLKTSNLISVKRPTDGEIRPVTIKRLRTDMGVSAHVVKKPKMGASSAVIKKPTNAAGPLRLCGFSCPGQTGIPPTLLCDLCMCLFHPECVGRTSGVGSFVCEGCGGDKSASAAEPVAATKAVIPALDTLLNSRAPPPPLHAKPAAAAYPPTAPPPLRQGVPSVRPAATQPSLATSTPPPPALTRAPVPVTSAAKTDTPVSQPAISGQLLTLPANVASRLDAASPLAVKMGGQSVVIPPNCFVNTPQGLKIFLPAGTLPVQNNANVPMNINFQQQKVLQTGRINKGAGAGTSSKQAEDAADSSNQAIAIDLDAPSKKSQRMANKICHFQKLHAGFDCMVHIFRFLSTKDLLVAGQVCQLWKQVATHRILWRYVRLRKLLVTSWEKAGKYLQMVGASTLDMRGLHLPDNVETFWQSFVAELDQLRLLNKIHFCQSPPSVLHAVADRFPYLEGLTALSITELPTEDSVSSGNTPAKLNIGKFTKLTKLKELKLRGLCGLELPTFSFSGGIADLGSLSNLKTLAITTLKDVSEEELGFIESLAQLETLEFGECTNWTAKTVSKLSKLEKLKHLRLEQGGPMLDVTAWHCLKEIKSLTKLEFFKFHIDEGLAHVLPELTQVQQLSVWPDPKDQAEKMNSSTLNAVQQMAFLKQLQWGVMVGQRPEADSNSEHNNNGSGDEAKSGSAQQASQRNGAMQQTMECIPFLASQAGGDAGAASTGTEYISVKQLIDKLRTFLPDTKLIVFKTRNSTASGS